MKGDSVTVTYGDGKTLGKWTVEATRMGGRVQTGGITSHWLEVTETTVSGRVLTRLSVPSDKVLSIVERNGIPGKQGAAKP